MSRRSELGSSVLLFVGLGLGWAALARLFMACFTDDPSFSVEGTGGIVALVLLEFIGLGAVRGARLSGRTRWWRVAPVPGLLLFFSPGMLLLPCVVAGAVVGRFRRPSIRMSLALVGVSGSVAPLVLLSSGATDNPPAPTLLAGMVLYSVCGLALVAAVQEWSRPWVKRSFPEGNFAAQT
ncbi:hypothetical protein ABTZ46_12570 [Nocardioides sp. NPDC126508]